MDATRWLDTDENLLWRSYLDATRLLFRTLDRQLTRDSGIGFADFEILVLLSEAPDRRLRMSALADASSTSRSGITRAVHRLERAGRVRRADCESDRRGAWAELTDAGAAELAAAVPGHVAAVRDALLDRVDPADAPALTRAFTAVRDHARVTASEQHPGSAA